MAKIQKLFAPVVKNHIFSEKSKTMNYKKFFGLISPFFMPVFFLGTKSEQTAVLVLWSAAQQTTEMIADQQAGQTSGPAPAYYQN